MQSIDLNLLKSLDALLQEQSVLKAAERLRLSSPAMSRALGRARELLGDPLLVRAGRGLVATPKALELRGRVHALLAEAHSLLGPSEAAQPSSFRRSLTLRVDDAVIVALGPTLLARLRRAAPGVVLIFQSEGAEEVSALRDGSVDLDIGVQGPLGPEIRAVKLLEDDVVLLVNRRCRLPGRIANVEPLADLEHVVVSRRGQERGPLDEQLERHGLRRVVRAVVANHLAAAALVAGAGKDTVTLVPRLFAASVSELLQVRTVTLPLAMPRFRVALAWHPRFDADPAHAWLREQIRQECAALQRAFATMRSRRAGKRRRAPSTG